MIRLLTLLLIIITSSASGQYSLCDSVIRIPASAIGQPPFFWDVSTGQTEDETDIFIVIREVGDYSVTLISGTPGCVLSTVERFSVDTCNDWTFWMPNAVTLRGVNRDWFPVGHNIVIDSVMIFDRWGLEMYVGSTAWSPSDKSPNVPIGVYACKVFFTIPGKIKREVYGRITVIN